MDEKYTVAIIGCGRLGQHYAEVYQTLPNTELVAIAEYNPERRQAVGERFGIRALYQDAQDLFRHIVPTSRSSCCPASTSRRLSSPLPKLASRASPPTSPLRPAFRM